MLWPDDDGADDITIDLPEDGVHHPVLVDGLVVEPSVRAAAIHIRQDGRYLSIDPLLPFAQFARDLPGPLEAFQPVSPEIVARLRAVLAGPARLAGTDQAAEYRLTDGFRLHLQGLDLPLWTATAAPDGGLSLHGTDGSFTLVPVQDPARPDRVMINGVKAELPPVDAAAAVPHGRGHARTIAVGDEYAYPPTTVCNADQLWMQQRPWFPDRQVWGHIGPTCELAATRDAYVLMSRGQEGTIFDRDRIYTDTIYLDTIPIQGAGPFSRHGGRAYIDTAALDDAPLASGPHAVFYSGFIANYFHWLIEAMIPLCAMAPHLPPGTKLLLPAPLDAMRDGPQGAMLPTHQAMLEDWGFGDMPRTVVRAPVCKVEEVYWLRNLNLDSFPAEILREARQRAWTQLAPVAPDDPRGRVYIRRPATRRVHNAAEIEALVTQLGFTIHELPGLTVRAQMALFRNAEFVIAPHGADLSNLLFCAPGTRVIELSPDLQYRNFFAQIADKLGLSHGVLPCPTIGGHFDSDFHVDPGRLTVLHALMQMRS